MDYNNTIKYISTVKQDQPNRTEQPEENKGKKSESKTARKTTSGNRNKREKEMEQLHSNETHDQSKLNLWHDRKLYTKSNHLVC